jgi:hypothetical protein
MILRRSGKSFLGLGFGISAITVGMFSLIYDITYLRLTQLIDISGMLVFILFLIYLAAYSIKKFSFAMYLLICIPIFAAALTASYMLGGQSGNIIFGSLILGLLLLEIYCHLKNIHTDYRPFIIGLALMAIGFGFWYTDAARILCFDFGLLNGRSVFHFFTSVTIYQLYLFYSSQIALSKLQ